MPGYSGGGTAAPKYKAKPLTTNVGSGKLPSRKPNQDAGKGSINLLDVGSSVAGTAKSFAEFGGGLVGGIAGAVGAYLERHGFVREGLLRNNWTTHIGLRDSVVLARFPD